MTLRKKINRKIAVPIKLRIKEKKIEVNFQCRCIETYIDSMVMKILSLICFLYWLGYTCIALLLTFIYVNIFMDNVYCGSLTKNIDLPHQ